MNALNREIEQGEIVVLKKETFKPEYQELKHRLFKVSSGFGMHSFTSGGGIFGEFLEDGERCRYDGYDIDPKETESYQSEHGKFSK